MIDTKKNNKLMDKYNMNATVVTTKCMKEGFYSAMASSKGKKLLQS